MRLTDANNDTPIFIEADGLMVGEEPAGQTCVTVLATGQKLNVKESPEQVNAMIEKEKAAK